MEMLHWPMLLQLTCSIKFTVQQTVLNIQITSYHILQSAAIIYF
jgi:hypothetical protein